MININSCFLLKSQNPVLSWLAKEGKVIIVCIPIYSVEFLHTGCEILDEKVWIFPSLVQPYQLHW